MRISVETQRMSMSSRNSPRTLTRNRAAVARPEDGADEGVSAGLMHFPSPAGGPAGVGGPGADGWDGRRARNRSNLAQDLGESKLRKGEAGSEARSEGGAGARQRRRWHADDADLPRVNADQAEDGSAPPDPCE